MEIRNSKTCCLCNNEKPLELFAKNGDRGFRSYCKLCDAGAQKRYRESHREILNERRRKQTANDPKINRNYNLRQKYGITLGQWESLFDSQNRVCKICKTDQPKGRGWQTDHDHSTGKIRGILCHSCNSLIGHSMENENIMLSAIQYLKDTK